MRFVVLLVGVGLVVALLMVPKVRERWLPKAQQQWSKTKHKMSSHSSLLSALPTKKAKAYPKGSFPRAPKAIQAKWVKVHWKNPARTFYALPRIGKVQRYPCGQCHDGSMKPGNKSHFRATHGGIKLQHASSGVLKCTSCHSSKNMNQLKTPSGQLVSFNQSHLLCGSCHSRQVKDWVGGAHGKRVKFWQGVRVVQTCTSCHNPHKPKFGKRWPKAFFKVPGSKKSKAH